MQFYKFEGFTVSENWSEENNDRRVMREKVRKISMKTNSFNRISSVKHMRLFPELVLTF